jgi:hypothetical protein
MHLSTRNIERGKNTTTCFVCNVNRTFRIARRARHDVDLARHQPNFEDAPNMTRTPTTSVTAIAIAARAFAWDIRVGAHGATPKRAFPHASSSAQLPRFL